MSTSRYQKFTILLKIKRDFTYLTNTVQWFTMQSRKIKGSHRRISLDQHIKRIFIVIICKQEQECLWYMQVN